jgi:hypothetical protein
MANWFIHPIPTLESWIDESLMTYLQYPEKFCPAFADWEDDARYHSGDAYECH